MQRRGSQRAEKVGMIIEAGRRLCAWFWGIPQRRVEQRVTEERLARAVRERREREILDYERKLNEALARDDAAEAEKARAAISAITASTRREQELVQNLFGGGGR